MIDVCCTSDLHGILPVIKKPFDLLLLAGDIVNLYCQREPDATRSWYTKSFADWLNKLPYKDSESKVILIAGNHEVGWQRLTFSERKEVIQKINEKTNNRLVYLEDEHFIFKGIKIFGTPYCKIFGNWAFMCNNKYLKEHYSKCDSDCDILLTHDAPYGVSDMCFDWVDWGRTPMHIGNEPLRDMILEKQPKYCIHGHLHSANHDKELLGDTEVYCVSLVNEAYKEVYEPLYLTF